MNMQDRIANGMNWLDAVKPSWRSRLDLSELDLGNPAYCIIGQVFRRDPDEEFGVWTRTITQFDLSNRETRELGFEALDHEDYSDLTAAWKEALR